MASATRLPLNVVFSSSAIFESGWTGPRDLAAWRRYQIEHEQEPMAPAPGLVFLQRLLALNRYPTFKKGDNPVRVKIISQQPPDVAVRFLNSLEHHGITSYYDAGLLQCSYLNELTPKRALNRTLSLLGHFNSHLFVTKDELMTRQLLKQGCAAVCLSPMESESLVSVADGLIVAFDGDAVIFGDEAERVFEVGGLKAFAEGESEQALMPLSQGPLCGFLLALSELRKKFSDKKERSPLQIVLVTARSTPAQKRVLLTLRSWGVSLDEAHFVAGDDKGPYLASLGATIFFDDSTHNIHAARKHGIPAAHVPWGVRNG